MIEMQALTWHHEAAAFDADRGASLLKLGEEGPAASAVFRAVGAFLDRGAALGVGCHDSSLTLYLRLKLEVMRDLRRPR
jgi:hypothetical protein